MATSFDGATIFILADDVPKSLPSNVTERHIPGGNNNFIDLGGLSMPRITYTLMFETGADAITFEAKQGVQGTLITFDGTYIAVLAGMRRIAHGVSAGGEAVISCEFIIVSS